MKKLICLLLMLTLIFSLAACGGLPEAPPPKGEGDSGDSEITAADLPSGDPASGKDTELVVVLPDGSEKTITLGEVIEKGKLIKSVQSITQKKGEMVEAVFQAITVKELLNLAGYTGGATNFVIEGMPFGGPGTGDDVVRELAVAAIENPGAMMSLARDGEWNDPQTQGAFRFVLKDESPKDTWVKGVTRVVLK